MKEQRGVVYARPVGYRPLELDLYRPDGPARGLCVYLHGGGWRTGGRRDEPVDGFFRTVTDLGLAVASVDYRLSGEATFPAQLDDVVAAVEYLDGDGGDTVVWGDSAGAHLAALYALTATRHPVRAVVCWYPPTDLDALSRDVDEAGGRGDRSAGSREGQLIGYPLDDRPDLVAAASPVRYARAGAPPFLFLHGTADRAVPARQSRRLAEALTARGGSATVELVEGAGHTFPELDPAARRRLVTRSVEFLLEAR